MPMPRPQLWAAGAAQPLRAAVAPPSIQTGVAAAVAQIQPAPPPLPQRSAAEVIQAALAAAPVIPPQLACKLESIAQIRACGEFLDPGAHIDDDAAGLLSEMFSMEVSEMQQWVNSVARLRAATASGGAASAPVAPMAEPRDYALWFEEVLPVVFGPGTAMERYRPAVPVGAGIRPELGHGAGVGASLAAAASASRDGAGVDKLAAPSAVAAAASAAEAEKPRSRRKDGGPSKPRAPKRPRDDESASAAAASVGAVASSISAAAGGAAAAAATPVAGAAPAAVIGGSSAKAPPRVKFVLTTKASAASGAL